MTQIRLNFASLTCLALAALGLALGVWQWQRSLFKQDLADRRDRAAEQAAQTAPAALGSTVVWQPGLDARDWDQRPVVLSGAWQASRQIYLDNRALDGRAGVHLLAPLMLTDGSIAWVNRGWAPKPPGGSPADLVPFVEGNVHRPSAQPAMLFATGQASTTRRIELTRDPEALRQGALWQNFDAEASRQWLTAAGVDAAKVWPLIFWQTESPAEGLVLAVPNIRDDDVAMHRGYALQWWLLMLVALFFAWRLSRKDKLE
jgi:surfeit locus 1 family protein